MLAEMGLKMAESCSCAERANDMDRWGVDGCRKNRETIIGWLAESARTTSWKAWLSAGAIAVWTGSPITAAGIVDEAIRRAEQ
jgi:hypothetical protein